MFFHATQGYLKGQPSPSQQDNGAGENSYLDILSHEWSRTTHGAIRKSISSSDNLLGGLDILQLHMIESPIATVRNTTFFPSMMRRSSHSRGNLQSTRGHERAGTKKSLLERTGSQHVPTAVLLASVIGLGTLAMRGITEVHVFPMSLHLSELPYFESELRLSHRQLCRPE
jgi:hypothetical protein